MFRLVYEGELREVDSINDQTANVLEIRAKGHIANKYIYEFYIDGEELPLKLGIGNRLENLTK